MDLRQAKIYNDGSHYIAIKQTTRPKRPKKIKKERVVVVDESDIILKQGKEELIDENTSGNVVVFDEKHKAEQEVNKLTKTVNKPKEMTLKEVFNSLYSQTFDKRKKDRKIIIRIAMRKYFDDDKTCREYIEFNFDRVERNLISRRIRFSRKINMHPFNYFVTFTYNDELHTEESFQKKLKRYLYNMCQRYSWKYIAAWEHSPENNRLHLHGMFYIPDISIVGKIEKRKDYNIKTHKMQTVMQSDKILDKFGRNDFRELETEHSGYEALKYILKYIEKTGNKLITSGKLPAYVIGDVLPDDIMCNYGEDENKFVLADNFLCIDEGEILGEVSQETLKLMPKKN